MKLLKDELGDQLCLVAAKKVQSDPVLWAQTEKLMNRLMEVSEGNKICVVIHAFGLAYEVLTDNIITEGLATGLITVKKGEI